MLLRRVQSATSILKVWQKIHVPSACFHQKSGKNKTENHYDALGVPLFASEKEIKEAFIELSKKYHPDSDTSDKTLHEKYVKISAAYNVLSSAAEKEIYDEGLKAGLNDFENVSKNAKQESAAPKSADQEPEYYEHPNYYEDQEMKMKAAKFWEKNIGFSQARAQYSVELNKKESVGVRRVALATILLSLGATILLYRWLCAKFTDPEQRPRSSDSPRLLKHPAKAGRSGRYRRQDVSDNNDLTDAVSSQSSLYMNEKELKT